MKIAATYDNGNIFQHFGKTEFFKVYEVEDNKVISSEVISSNGTGHGALAGLLADQGISVLICGGIGGGAQSALGSGDKRAKKSGVVENGRFARSATSRCFECQCPRHGSGRSQRLGCGHGRPLAHFSQIHRTDG